jgi:hypothetical protein
MSKESSGLQIVSIVILSCHDCGHWLVKCRLRHDKYLRCCASHNVRHPKDKATKEVISRRNITK